MNEKTENRKEACKTYIEQTKHLSTLASAFLIPPAAIQIFLKNTNITFFLLAEISFVLSVIISYIVMGTIVGSQDRGDYDVYRTATRISSLLQFIFYILGLIFFFIMILT